MSALARGSSTMKNTTPDSPAVKCPGCRRAVIRARLVDGSGVLLVEARPPSSGDWSLTPSLFPGERPLAVRGASSRASYARHVCTSTTVRDFVERGQAAQRAVDDVVEAFAAGNFRRKKRGGDP